jgi:Protein of Unknown function (DUF2784)
MSPQVLTDLVVAVHFAFVLFVVLGGLLVLRWPVVSWIHLPAVAWGAIVEFSGSVCPLTPLENALRAQAGEAGYSGDFVSRYLLPTLYPESLTRSVQLILGAIVVGLNCAVYAWVWRRRKRRR